MEEVAQVYLLQHNETKRNETNRNGAEAES